MHTGAQEGISIDANAVWIFAADHDHYFKRVLHIVGVLAAGMIRPHENHNHGAAYHHPDTKQYPLFQICLCCYKLSRWTQLFCPFVMSTWYDWKWMSQDCIGAIDMTHVRAVLPGHKQINFIGRNGCPLRTSWSLAISTCASHSYCSIALDPCTIAVY